MFPLALELVPSQCVEISPWGSLVSPPTSTTRAMDKARKRGQYSEVQLRLHVEGQGDSELAYIGHSEINFVSRSGSHGGLNL